MKTKPRKLIDIDALPEESVTPLTKGRRVLFSPLTPSLLGIAGLFSCRSPEQREMAKGGFGGIWKSITPALPYYDHQQAKLNHFKDLLYLAEFNQKLRKGRGTNCNNCGANSFKNNQCDYCGTQY